MNFTSKVQLQNSTARPMTFLLEPWGDVYRIPVGKTAHIVGRGSQPGCFHLECSDDGIQVWSWEDSEVQVVIGGEHEGRTVRPAQRRSSHEGSAESVRRPRGVVQMLGRAMLAAGDRLLRRTQRTSG